MVFLHREHTALAKFLQAWAASCAVSAPEKSVLMLAKAVAHEALAAEIATSLNTVSIAWHR